MLSRVAALAVVPFTALTLATGCDVSGAPAASPPSAPATASATASASASASTSASAGAADSPAGGTEAGGDTVAAAGTGGIDWKTIVAACPNEGQDSLVQRVVLGDANGDGTDDALVARTCDTTTAYWPSTVEVYDGTSPASKPELFDTLLTDVGADDSPWVTTLEAAGGTVKISAYGLGEDSARACPDYEFHYEYTVRGDTFRRGFREAVPSDDCHDLN